MATVVTHVPLPEVIPRVETGVIQFGDDWKGIFIRGDNALAYAMNLRVILEQSNTVVDPIMKIHMESLADLLESCHE